MMSRCRDCPATALRDASGPTIRLSRAAGRAVMKRHGVQAKICSQTAVGGVGYRRMLGRGMADDGPSGCQTVAHDGRWGAKARRAVGSRGTTGGGEPRHDGRWGAEARRAVTHGIVSSSVVTHAPVFSSFTAVFFGFMSHRFVHSSRWCRDPVVPWYVGDDISVCDDVSV